MQRNKSLTVKENCKERGTNPSIITLESPGDEEQFYTASLHFLKERLQEKNRNVSPGQKTTQSCCNLNIIENDLPTLRKTQSKLKFGFDLPMKPEYSLDMNKVLPFPKPKSTKDSFLTRLTNRFRKYRRSFVATDDSETEDGEMTNYSSFKFPRCERLHKYIDSSRLFNITEEVSRTSMKDVSKPVMVDNKGDSS
ncbi:hypothetical protein RR48_11522 [Papilio machaon]|uniref:Uncharacterized protein n=1 Tax=Papilio machaon TaxID=76193 RepID=A0A194R8R8_PAPMA|nr:hypothetical protein RR48_11522 [Papilio machaon]